MGKKVYLISSRKHPNLVRRLVDHDYYVIRRGEPYINILVADYVIVFPDHHESTDLEFQVQFARTLGKTFLSRKLF